MRGWLDPPPAEARSGEFHGDNTGLCGVVNFDGIFFPGQSHDTQADSRRIKQDLFSWGKMVSIACLDGGCLLAGFRIIQATAGTLRGLLHERLEKR